jgi:hypothetical protein
MLHLDFLRENKLTENIFGVLCKVLT